MTTFYQYLARTTKERYPGLGQLLGGYFHQDCCMYGETFWLIIHTYIEESSPADRAWIVREINKFKNDNPGRIEAAYLKEFNDDIILSYWGFTYETFLDEIQKRLSESL